MPKKSIFDRYETYDPSKEGYGNPNQWRQAFQNAVGNTTSIDKARQILGTTTNSSYQEIKRAYRTLAFQYHPDKNLNDQHTFQKIGEAYKIVLESLTPIYTQKEKIYTYLPQLLNEINESDIEQYITNPVYCAQEKHDGRRKILVSDKQIYTLNKKGKVVGSPECIEREARKLKRQFVLDGEEVNNTFYVFDILSLDNQDLRHLNYSNRWKHNFLENNNTIKTVYTAYSTQEKRKLYNDLKFANREGIVFKLLSGLHHEGYSDDQVKFKWYATASVIVIRQNPKQSVGIAIWNNGLEEIGNVTTIGHDKPEIGQIIEVKYLYAYRGGCLYQPSFLGIRHDVDKEDCTKIKLKFKP